MSIKKIIAIASAKGGVGKSSITTLSALSLAKKYNIGILDADIYGPNQHILFNIDTRKPEIVLKKSKKFFKPFIKNNIKISSMGPILDNDKAAIKFNKKIYTMDFSNSLISSLKLEKVYENIINA